jgi:hypothetical protein
MHAHNWKETHHSDHAWTIIVCYQEIDIPKDFTRSLRKWIPNSYYGPTDPFTSTTRIVALVATRQIENEELFSTYMDTFHN